MKKSKILMCFFTVLISTAALADQNQGDISNPQKAESLNESITDSVNLIGDLFDNFQFSPLGTTRDTGETRPMPDEDDGIPPRGRMCPNWPYCENYEYN